MAMRKVELELNVPDGWEVDGYRVPMSGEVYLSTVGQCMVSDGVSKIGPVLVLRQIGGDTGK